MEAVPQNAGGFGPVRDATQVMFPGSKHWVDRWWLTDLVRGSAAPGRKATLSMEVRFHARMCPGDLEVVTQGDDLLIQRPVDIDQLLHIFPGFGELLPRPLTFMAEQHDLVRSHFFLAGHPQFEPLVIDEHQSHTHSIMLYEHTVSSRQGGAQSCRLSGGYPGARSSPRHACGLNVSEFPHPCADAEQAWLLGCWGELVLQVFCESLHRMGYCDVAELLLERCLAEVGVASKKE